MPDTKSESILDLEINQHESASTDATIAILAEVLYFPADLDKKLKALAKKNHRSLTQEIILALEQHWQRETSKPRK